MNATLRLTLRAHSKVPQLVACLPKEASAVPFQDISDRRVECLRELITERTKDAWGSVLDHMTHNRELKTNKWADEENLTILLSAASVKNSRRLSSSVSF